MKLRTFQLCFGLVLAAWPAGAGKAEVEEIHKLAKIADDNLPSHPERALAACVAAMRVKTDDRAAMGVARACMDKVKGADVVTATYNAATAADATGHVDDAWTWCDAARMVDANRDCKLILDHLKLHRQDLLNLELGYRKLQDKSFADVDTALALLKSSNFPDILTQTVELSKAETQARAPQDIPLGNRYRELGWSDKAQTSCETALKANPSDPAAVRCMQEALANDQKSWSVIVAAKALEADGNHAAAVKSLTDLLALNTIGPEVRKSAQEALAEMRSSIRSVRDALKSAWIIQFLATSVLLAAAWFGLHIARWIWRKLMGAWRERNRKVRWAFLGVNDTGGLGASEAVLDALRRMPHEVQQSIWTPGRLALHAAGQAFEVWEDFGISGAVPAMHENVLGLFLNQGRAADIALASAFEGLQFTIGTVGLGGIAQFWHAIVNWWHDGFPAFSGAATQTATADTSGQQVAIRLTCSGGSYGTVSVVASTKVQDGVDTVGLTAARAAYKLLFRMTSHPEEVEQVDGHAAFRQGAKLLSCCVRSAGDSTDATRMAELNTALANLEFARQVFCRDDSHRKYYLQAMRFEAVTQALLGHTAAALGQLEELEDKASVGEDELSRALALEAVYNQGVLHLALAQAGSAAEVQLARQLFDWVAAAAPADPLGCAAVLRSAGLLASIGRPAWPQLDATKSDATITSAAAATGMLDRGVANKTGDERRAYSTLITETRRDLAIARMRYIAAFEVQNRGPFEIAQPSVPDPNIRRQIAECLGWFAQSDSFGSGNLNALVCRAHALLLSPGNKWRAAEFYARQALAVDKTCEFACYVAAEACTQRGDPAAAQLYLTNFAPSPITDPALCRLQRALNPPADQAAAAAACG